MPHTAINDCHLPYIAQPRRQPGKESRTDGARRERADAPL